VFAVALMIGVPAVSAQDDCATFTRTAWDAAAESCADLAAGTVCYGHGDISASLSPDAGPFDAAGDTVSLESVTALQLAPFDLDTGVWGIVYIALEAEEGATTVVLMGDVTVDSLSMDEIAFTSGTSSRGDCPGPVDGVLVTASGDAAASLTLNGETFTFGDGASAFFATEPDGSLVPTVLSGEITDPAGESIPAGADSGDMGLSDLFAPSPAGDTDDDGLPGGDPDLATGIYDPSSLLAHVTTQVENHDPDLAAGGDIALLSGTWEATPVTFAFEGCSESEEASLREAMGGTLTQEITFGETFDHRAFIEQMSQSELPPEMSFSNPAPNFYNYVMPTDWVIIYTDMYLISPTEWYGVYSFDRAPSDDTCRMAVASVFVRIGD
jgi:hypothetical protein